MRWTGGYSTVESSACKWRDTAGQHRHTGAVAAVVVADRAAGAEIGDAPGPGRAVAHAVAIAIAGDLIAEAAAAHVRIVKAPAGSLVPEVNRKTDKRTVARSQDKKTAAATTAAGGACVSANHTSARHGGRTCRKRREICLSLEIEKGILLPSIPRATLSHVHIFVSLTYINYDDDDALHGLEVEPKLILV